MSENPLVDINDDIEVYWPYYSSNGDITNQWLTGKIINIKKTKKIKNNSIFKYKINFNIIDNNNNHNNTIRKTRLNHLQWKIINKPLKSLKRYHMPPHKLILAPMVGGSELAYRLLCRRYGVQLAYTPMINSNRFVHDIDYRNDEFQTTIEDRPLVAHFSANDPDTFLQACRLIEDQCDAIDLNLGCPQRIAYTGHFGSYLLDDIDRPLVINLVKIIADNLSIPIFVKIRLLDTVDDTIRLCEQLIQAGASLIAIHARYRVNLVNRTGPGARDGPALLDQVVQIKQSLVNKCYYTPIISNGNVITYDDVINNLNYTKCDGIMSAEGILDNPALYNPSINNNKINNLDLVLEYLSLCELYPVKIKSIIFHIRRIIRDLLDKFQLLNDFIQLDSLIKIKKFIDLLISFTINPSNYIEYKNKQNELLTIQRNENQIKRKLYEERMIRKAKREKKPLDHYLNIGCDLPSYSELIELKKLSNEESFKIWKVKYFQHCYAYHFNENKCIRERTCGFLHADVHYDIDVDKDGSSNEQVEIFG